MKFNISNEHEKEEFFKKIMSATENAIWKELINGQHEYLEVEVNIKGIGGESEG